MEGQHHRYEQATTKIRSREGNDLDRTISTSTSTSTKVTAATTISTSMASSPSFNSVTTATDSADNTVSNIRNVVDVYPSAPSAGTAAANDVAAAGVTNPTRLFGREDELDRLRMAYGKFSRQRQKQQQKQQQMQQQQQQYHQQRQHQYHHYHYNRQYHHQDYSSGGGGSGSQRSGQSPKRYRGGGSGGGGGTHLEMGPVVLISGRSGTGKTSLFREFAKRIEKNHHVICGKYDPPLSVMEGTMIETASATTNRMNSNTLSFRAANSAVQLLQARQQQQSQFQLQPQQPYSAIAQAFGELCDKIISSVSPTEMYKIRTEVKQSVGTELQLLIHVIPSMDQLLGDLLPQKRQGPMPHNLQQHLQQPQEQHQQTKQTKSRKNSNHRRTQPNINDFNKTENENMSGHDRNSISGAYTSSSSSSSSPSSSSSLSKEHEWGRLIYAFKRFIRAICKASNMPVVLFLDDLHWADLPSLDFLNALLRDAEMLDQFCFIGAYQKGESTASTTATTSSDSNYETGSLQTNNNNYQEYLNLYHHQQQQQQELLATKVAEMSEWRHVETIELQDLSFNDLKKFLVETLNLLTDSHDDDDKIVALARIIHERTQGNIHLAKQLLQMMQEKGIIHRRQQNIPSSSPSSSSSTADAGNVPKWDWTIESVNNYLTNSSSSTSSSSSPMFNDVITILMDKLYSIKDPTFRRVMSLAAHLPTTFDIDTLLFLLNKEEEEEDELQRSQRRGQEHQRTQHQAENNDERFLHSSSNHGNNNENDGISVTTTATTTTTRTTTTTCEALEDIIAMAIRHGFLIASSSSSGSTTSTATSSTRLGGNGNGLRPQGGVGIVRRRTSCYRHGFGIGTFQFAHDCVKFACYNILHGPMGHHQQQQQPGQQHKSQQQNKENYDGQHHRRHGYQQEQQQQRQEEEHRRHIQRQQQLQQLLQHQKRHRLYTRLGLYLMQRVEEESLLTLSLSSSLPIAAPTPTAAKAGAGMGGEDWMIFLAADLLNASSSDAIFPSPTSNATAAAGIGSVRTAHQWLLEKIKINVHVGIRAFEISALLPSSQYLSIALSALAEIESGFAGHYSLWKHQYDLCHKLYATASEVELILGNYERGDALCQVLLSKTRATDHTQQQHKQQQQQPQQLQLQPHQQHTQKLRSYYQLGKALALQSRHHEAINYHLSALHHTNSFPKRFLLGHVLRELSSVRNCLKKATDFGILNLPMADNESTSAIMEHLLALAVQSYHVSNTAMMVLSVLRAITLTLTDGISPYSPLAFSAYGVLLSGSDQASAERVARLSESMLTETKSKHLEGMVLYQNACFVDAWSQPILQTMENFFRGYRSALESGFVEDGYRNWAYSVTHVYTSGCPLPLIIDTCIKVNQKLYDYKIHPLIASFEKVTKTVQYLTGDISDAINFDKALARIPVMKGGSEKAGVNNSNDNNGSGNGSNSSRLGPNYWTWHCWMHMQLAVYFQEYEIAEKLIEPFKHYAATDTSYIVASVRVFFSGIAASVLALHTGKGKYKTIAETCTKQMKSMMSNKGTNAIHRYDLLLACAAAYKKGDFSVKELYDKAIKSAVQSGFIQDAALAYELAGEYFLLYNSKFWAQHYITRAFELYSEWGATAKVDHIRKLRGKYIAVGAAAVTNMDHVNAAKQFWLSGDESGIYKVVDFDMLSRSGVREPQFRIYSPTILPTTTTTATVTTTTSSSSTNSISAMNSSSSSPSNNAATAASTRTSS